MGELSEFMDECFGEFEADLRETVWFTIESQPGRYRGDLDELGVESTGLRAKGGGLLSSYTGCILAAAGQFASITDPERTLQGKRLTLKDREYRITSATLDPSFLTIRLENWKK